MQPPLPFFITADMSADDEYHYRCKRKRAQKKVHLALKRGRMVKGATCEKCTKSPHSNHMHAHHEDYDKPLDVVWLCSSCHGKRHGEINRAAWIEYKKAEASLVELFR